MHGARVRYAGGLSRTDFENFDICQYTNIVRICNLNISIWFFFSKLEGVFLPKITSPYWVFHS